MKKANITTLFLKKWYLNVCASQLVNQCIEKILSLHIQLSIWVMLYCLHFFWGSTASLSRKLRYRQKNIFCEKHGFVSTIKWFFCVNILIKILYSYNFIFFFESWCMHHGYIRFHFFCKNLSPHHFVLMVASKHFLFSVVSPLPKLFLLLLGVWRKSLHLYFVWHQ